MHPAFVYSIEHMYVHPAREYLLSLLVPPASTSRRFQFNSALRRTSGFLLLATRLNPCSLRLFDPTLRIGRRADAWDHTLGYARLAGCPQFGWFHGLGWSDRDWVLG